MNCEKCGKPLSNTAFCENCGHTNQAQPVSFTQQPVTPAEKPENLVTGIVGALLGSVIGGASIILLSRLGYVASISGLILAVCTLKGYELLGGKLSKKGIVVSLVLMAVMPYIADRLDWAILLMEEFSSLDFSLGEAFGLIPTLIEEGAIESDQYISNLVMIYVFVLIGAFSTVFTLLKKKK